MGASHPETFTSIVEPMSDIGYFAEGVAAAKFVFALAEQYGLSLLGKEASGRHR